jgi:hypothetical protein
MKGYLRKEVFMPVLSTITFGFGGYIFYDRPDSFIKFGLFSGFNVLLYGFTNMIIPTVSDLTLNVRFFHFSKTTEYSIDKKPLFPKKNKLQPPPETIFD